jgi:hypothetical protein
MVLRPFANCALFTWGQGEGFEKVRGVIEEAAKQSPLDWARPHSTLP